MPIKPENKKLYPENWKEIRKNILIRAGNKCEFCRLKNYAKIKRYKNGKVHVCSGIEIETAMRDDKKTG